MDQEVVHSTVSDVMALLQTHSSDEEPVEIINNLINIDDEVDNQPREDTVNYFLSQPNVQQFSSESDYQGSQSTTDHTQPVSNDENRRRRTPSEAGPTPKRPRVTAMTKLTAGAAAIVEKIEIGNRKLMDIEKQRVDAEMKRAAAEENRAAAEQKKAKALENIATALSSLVQNTNQNN